MTRVGIIVLALLAATGAKAECIDNMPGAFCLDTAPLIVPENPVRLPTCGPEVHGSCIVPMSGGGGGADGNNWHLLTVSYGGAVSLLKGLTKKECETIQIKLARASLPDWTCSGPPWVAVEPTNSSDIKTAECFE